MAVYVAKAGSADSFRIERIYFDGGSAHGFASADNGIAPVEPVQVEKWDAAPRPEG